MLVLQKTDFVHEIRRRVCIAGLTSNWMPKKARGAVLSEVGLFVLFPHAAFARNVGVKALEPPVAKCG